MSSHLTKRLLNIPKSVCAAPHYFSMSYESYHDAQDFLAWYDLYCLAGMPSWAELIDKKKKSELYAEPHIPFWVIMRAALSVSLQKTVLPILEAGETAVPRIEIVIRFPEEDYSGGYDLYYYRNVCLRS